VVRAAEGRPPRRFGAAIGVVAALFAAVGAAAWMSGSETPETAVEAPPAAPAAAAETVPAPAPAAEVPAEPAPAPLAAEPASAGVSLPQPSPRASARVAPRPRPALSRTSASRSERARTAAAESPRPVRYRNARNMRLFCERAGRGTPQCRSFLRNRQGDD
jgi:type IV secretory pathway VirB10-like protein